MDDGEFSIVDIKYKSISNDSRYNYQIKVTRFCMIFQSDLSNFFTEELFTGAYSNNDTLAIQDIML